MDNTEKGIRLSELENLKNWLDNLKEDEHYCGYELDFGLEKEEVYDYINSRVWEFGDEAMVKLPDFDRPYNLDADEGEPVWYDGCAYHPKS